MRYIAILIAILSAVPHAPVNGHAAESRRDVLMSAMRDEMTRNVERLSLPEMAPPFFISYLVFDAETIDIRATLGSLVRSERNRHRTNNVRVLVGNYALNDENFSDSSFGGSSSMIHGAARMPVEDDYDAIRRALWIITDGTYKQAAGLFERKKTALTQQNVAVDELPPDFSRAPEIHHRGEPASPAPDTVPWENFAERLSAIFADYPGIYSSSVRVMFYRGDMLFVSSEGTEVVEPLTLASINVNAYTQAEDGEPLSDHLAWQANIADELPEGGEVEDRIREMADRLIRLRTAPVFDDTYFGPVLLEGQAAGEFFSQRLFGGSSGLMASRRPIVSRAGGFAPRTEETTIEDRIGRRILARDLSVRALPRTRVFDGVTLIGAFDVDAEGVVPPEEIVLVDHGILKTLLNNRTPTDKIGASNGHQRPVTGSGYWTSTALGPGVVSVESDNGTSRDELKRELLKRAVDEGMEYGILIRALKPAISGESYSDPMVRMTRSFGGSGPESLSGPTEIYKVYVEDGREELVRSVTLSPVTLSTLRHIAGVTASRMVYNTLATPNHSAGIPASFIVPGAVLLEELEIAKEQRDYTPRLPAVESPLAESGSE